MLIETLAVKLIGDVTDFNSKMAGAASAVQAVGDKMQATGDRMQAIGQKWSMFVSAPLIAMGKSAIDSAADFEQSMNVMEQVTGATTDQMKMLSDQALQTGKDSVFSAGEVAKAQLALSKANFDVNATMAATPGVVALAAAADIELAAAAEITANAINAFNLPAADASRIADMLAASANASTASVYDQAKALQMSSAIMAGYGFTAEETITILTQMANAGIKNSDAGTAVKTAFMRLAAPTDAARAVLEQYNIQIYDANGNMNDAKTIIDQFNQKLGANAQVTRAVGGVTEKLNAAYEDAMEDLPKLTAKVNEQRAQMAIYERELREVVAQYGEGSIQADKKRLAIDKLNGKITESSNALGTANATIDRWKAASQSATTVTNDLTEAQRNSALETLFGTDGLRVFNILLAQGSEETAKMTEIVTKQGAASEVSNARMKGLAGAIEYFQGTIDTLMIQTGTPWLDMLSENIRLLADWIAKFGELDPAVQRNIVIMAALVAAVGPVLIYTGLLISSVGSLVTAFGTLTAFILANPITALSTLTAALIVFSIGWEDNWFGVQEKTRVVVDYVSLRLADLDAWIRDNVPELGPWLDAFQGFASGAKQGWDDAFPNMRKTFIEFSDTISSEIPKLIGSFGRLWIAVFGGEDGDSPETAGRKLVSRFLNFVGLVTSAVGTIVAQIRIMVDGLGYAIQTVRSFLSGDFDAASTAAGNFTNSMKEFGSVTGAQYQRFTDYMREWQRQNDPEGRLASGGGSGGFGYAEGGWVGHTGRYRVGERGTEMVELPAGAYVHNDRDTAAMGRPIEIKQFFSGNPDAAMVRSASRDGVLLALRQAGYA